MSFLFTESSPSPLGKFLCNVIYCWLSLGVTESERDTQVFLFVTSPGSSLWHCGRNEETLNFIFIFCKGPIFGADTSVGYIFRCSMLASILESCKWRRWKKVVGVMMERRKNWKKDQILEINFATKWLWQMKMGFRQQILTGKLRFWSNCKSLLSLFGIDFGLGKGHGNKKHSKSERAYIGAIGIVVKYEGRGRN